jgi:hypothetical protein
MQNEKKKRFAISGTEFKEVKDDEVDYELTSPNSFFGTHINLVPLQSSVAAPRVFYGSRFMNQAVPLAQAEKPWVQGLIDGEDRTFEEYSGDHAGNVRSKVDGVISKINDHLVEVTDLNGEKHEYDLYKDFSFNRKTGISSKPLIKKGDQITSGQLLAHSNYTSDDGTLSLGTNARVGLIPYKGLSMDDAVVVSESFAKRLTSEQLMTYNQDKGRDVKLGKNHFHTLFPDKFTKAQMDKLDDNGVVMPGAVLEEGDPIVLSTSPRIISSSQQQLGKLSRHMLNSRRDSTQVWKYKVPGVVTEISNNRGDVKVNVKSQLPANPGDKMVFRAGQKGTISRIIPDEHMPRTEDGNPLEVLLNPLGIPSRVNNSAVYELLLGKIAAKTGNPYRLPQFNGEGDKWYDFVQGELDKHGIKSTERVFDPKDDRWINNPITVGNGYVLKLTHMSEGKLSGRGTGAYATGDQSPLKGGDDVAQAKRLSGLETTALLSSGAYKTLKETATLTGTRNDAYWRLVRMGQNPEAPREPFAWNKFQALITGAGLHANPITRDKLRLSPMTDKKLEALRPQEITKGGEFINMKTMSPVDGGIFDNALATNNKWGVINLDFPVPNPAFETPILKLLGLTKKQMNAIMLGKEEINGQTGPEALKSALAAIDMDEMEDESLKIIQQRKKTKRPLAIQRLNYIRGLRKNEISPEELMVQKVPVIPTKFRPFSMVGETFVAGDANALYTDLIDVKDVFKKTKATLGDEGAAENRMDVYNAVKAVYGYGEPVNAKNAERGFSGFLKQITGDSPKFGWVNRKLLSKTKDLSGRGVITVDPELEMDEIGIPEKLAWRIYQPFIQRKLVRGGMAPAQAVLAIKDQTPQAKKAMELEMKDRPVMYSRAPVWHKFGVLGAWPRLIEGNNIAINPLVTKGLNADFDGDTANVHVPVMDDTVEEVTNKLMPSKMLFTIRNEEQVMAQPSQETLLGLFAAIRAKAKNKHVFRTRAEAVAAIKSGKVDLSDEIEILGEKKASNSRRAVVIKGNPKYIEGNEEADEFYAKVEEYLKELGYDVDLDPGEPYTQPEDGYDMWVGHSRGGDRLRFAPEGVKTLLLDDYEEDHAGLGPDIEPGPNHYILNESMKEAIKEASTKEEIIQKVLAHVGGASGSGKTTLVNEMSEQYPDVLFRDLDEFDDQAVVNLGWEDIRKRDYTDEMLQQLADERQRLMDEFVDEADKPVVFAGHHTEGHRVEGSRVLDIPTENRFLLDVDAETSAQRAFDRSQTAPVGKRRTMEEMPEDIAEAQEMIDQLTGLGYEAHSPDVVRQKIVELMEGEEKQANKSVPNPALHHGYMPDEFKEAPKWDWESSPEGKKHIYRKIMDRLKQNQFFHDSPGEGGWDTSKVTDVSKIASQEEPLPTVLDQLIAAKSLSDKGNYTRKQRMLTQLMEEYPDEFFVDDTSDNRYYGITHIPTGFRIHTDYAGIPPAVMMNKQATFEQFTSTPREAFEPFYEGTGGLDKRIQETADYGKMLESEGWHIPPGFRTSTDPSFYDTPIPQQVGVDWEDYYAMENPKNDPAKAESLRTKEKPQAFYDLAGKSIHYVPPVGEDRPSPKIQQHEMTHATQDDMLDSSDYVEMPDYFFTTNEENEWDPDKREYLQDPWEVGARLGHINRNYAKAMGENVTSPEIAQKALQWYRQQKQDYDALQEDTNSISEKLDIPSLSHEEKEAILKDLEDREKRLTEYEAQIHGNEKDWLDAYDNPYWHILMPLLSGIQHQTPDISKMAMNGGPPAGASATSGNVVDQGNPDVDEHGNTPADRKREYRWNDGGHKGKCKKKNPDGSCKEYQD